MPNYTAREYLIYDISLGKQWYRVLRFKLKDWKEPGGMGGGGGGTRDVFGGEGEMCFLIAKAFQMVLGVCGF